MRIVSRLLAAGLITAPALVGAQEGLAEKLQVHGYLTQGFGESSKIGINGLPTAEATGDYRVAALQFRYALTEKGAMTVQLRHRRLGTSPLQGAEPDVGLNWAFYQQRFDFGTSVKVGKLPIPRGIYSEIRSVGTLLPLFRAPVGTYLEGYETIDGASVTHSVELGKSWSLEGTGYGGGFDVNYPFARGTSYMVTKLRFEGVYGGQAWLSTPVEGLRLGLGGMRFRSRKMTDTSSVPYNSSWIGSLDLTRSRYFVRSEFSHIALSSSRSHMISYFAQGGVRVVDRLTLTAQNDIQDQKVSRGAAGYFGYRPMRDAAVGVTYALNPSMNVKFEQHDMKGYNFDVPTNVMGATQKTRYFLASVAASF